MARQATVNDLPKLLEYAQAFHALSPYRDIPFNVATVELTILNGIHHGGVFINDHGFIVGVVTPFLMNEDIKVAAELAWYCPEGDGQGLKAAFQDWAVNEQGANALQISTLVNEYSERLGTKLIADGFTPSEISYLKEV